MDAVTGAVYRKRGRMNNFTVASAVDYSTGIASIGKCAIYENISIFYNKPPTYNPQGLIKVDKVIKNSGIKNPTSNKKNGDKTSANNAIKNEYYKQEYTNYPNMILQFSNSDNKQVHPT